MRSRGSAGTSTPLSAALYPATTRATAKVIGTGGNVPTDRSHREDNFFLVAVDVRKTFSFPPSSTLYDTLYFLIVL